LEENVPIAQQRDNGSEPQQQSRLEQYWLAAIQERPDSQDG
jgi:hypothetical protein